MPPLGREARAGGTQAERRRRPDVVVSARSVPTPSRWWCPWCWSGRPCRCWTRLGDVVEGAGAHARCQSVQALGARGHVEIFPVEPKLTVPALFSRTPIRSARRRAGRGAVVELELRDVERATRRVELQAGWYPVPVSMIRVVDRSAAAFIACGASIPPPNALVEFDAPPRCRRRARPRPRPWPSASGRRPRWKGWRISGRGRPPPSG